MNIHWPAKPGSMMAPWYTIARRLLAVPFLYFGACIVFVSMLVGWGLESARNAWKEITL